MSYTIGRGEQGVLTFEPYKSYLLPHWRFRTLPIAQASSSTLYSKFLDFYEARDFVGMDMTRKFIQMGMTRSKRYANYRGGRKYDVSSESGEKVVREKGRNHEGKEEKEKCSEVFRGYWEKCNEYEGYKELRREWEAEKRVWEKSEVKVEEGEDEGGVKDYTQHKRQEVHETEEKTQARTSKRIKIQNSN